MSGRSVAALGRVAERLKAHDWKSCGRKLTWVRIPPRPFLVGSQDDTTVVRRIPVGFGAWLSPVERCVRVAEVPGSNPGAPMDGCGWYGGHGSTRRGAGVGRTGPPRKRCVGNHTGVRIPPPPLLDRPSSSDHDMRSLGDLALPGLLSLMPSGFSPGARRQALGDDLPSARSAVQ